MPEMAPSSCFGSNGFTWNPATWDAVLKLPFCPGVIITACTIQLQTRVERFVFKPL